MARNFEQRIAESLLLRRHIDETHTLPVVQVNIHPPAPFVAIQRIHRLGALLVSQAIEKGPRGHQHSVGGYTGWFDDEQSRGDHAIARHAGKRRPQADGVCHQGKHGCPIEINKKPKHRGNENDAPPESRTPGHDGRRGRTCWVRKGRRAPRAPAAAPVPFG
jgi:hypothetical protein